MFNDVGRSSFALLVAGLIDAQLRLQPRFGATLMTAAE
jgi:hypothetical protein